MQAIQASRKMPLLAAALLVASALPGQPSRRAGAGLPLAPASYIGLGIVEVDEDAARGVGLVKPHGVEISDVVHGSPAATAGLKEGDLVLTYRGERVQGIEHFARLVKETAVGRLIELGVARNGQRQTVRVTIGQRETGTQGTTVGEAVRQRMESMRQRMDESHRRMEEAHQRMDESHRRRDAQRHRTDAIQQWFDFDFPQVRLHIRNRRLGAELEGIRGQFAAHFGVEEGVLIRSVDEASRADRAGLRAGDVIVSVAGTAVREAREVGQALAPAPDRSVAVEVMRDGALRRLLLEAEARAEPTPVLPVATPR